MVWKPIRSTPRPTNTVSPPNFLDWQTRNGFLRHAYIADVPQQSHRNWRPEEIVVQAVSLISFCARINPFSHRFTPENWPSRSRQRRHSQLRLWKDRFASDPAIVGKSILLNGKTPDRRRRRAPKFQLVSSRTARSPAQSLAYVALRFSASVFHDHKQIGRFLTVAARLKARRHLFAGRRPKMTHRRPARTRVSDLRGIGVNVRAAAPADFPANFRPALLILFGRR